jgi:hypothetical protein
MKLTLAFLATSLLLGLMVVGGGTTGFAAQETWTGDISDSTCGASHVKMSQGLFNAHECTLACAEKGKFVFVNAADGKIFQIANQDFAALKEMAGETVKLTGELDKDELTIAKLELVKS